ncbi:carbohydrate ABC transporter permease [Streptomonospora nanhaiensis]|uniref:Multiple sugar transport system permease protein n=1 Tax=Streptomonospora nanhaiensis TaxID=1323731 RepID=A0A853BHN8_9ACTN|nr:carbohydrate ABC transporter permease [Streptomonospora nanhaiensis]MBV2364453.1 carbohydrate ABC transporter permease [Streptomonospora nanhaiensis]MBX9387895.1 carbohydrate ABC transporter permease [Streptomonospora nanhaiensis]NYI94087.1 multiple sugar transport system permease protein [Streptomonospora nanhaiensis]
MSARDRSLLHRVFSPVTLGAVVLVLFTAMPLYWMVVNSLKPVTEVGAMPPTFWPGDITGANYVSAFVDQGFGRYILNSLVVCLSSTVVVVSLATFAGYALARTPMRGRGPVMIALLMVSVYPPIAVLVPLYVMARELGMLNSYPGLIIPYVAFNLPFAIWIMRNYMLSVPGGLEDAARVDGASATRTVLSIILPQVRPGLFTAGVFTFTATWTEFLMALTLNSQDAYRTIPVGIALMGTVFEVPYGMIFAAAVAVTAPIAVLVLIFRKSVVAGLTAGAIKG